MQFQASRKAGGRHTRVLLLASASMILLSGCGMPDSMHVRRGSDPHFEDDHVRFRTTYYFRVFDLCEGRTPMDRPRDDMKVLFDSAQRGPYYLKTDSLYRFIMTGKSSAYSNIHFEAGSLRKEQIDPFGMTVNYSKEANAFVIQNQDQARTKAEYGESIGRIRELLKLREEIGGKVEGGNQAMDVIVRQYLDLLAPNGRAKDKPEAEPNGAASMAGQTGAAKEAQALTGNLTQAASQAATLAGKLGSNLQAAEQSLTKELAAFAQSSAATPSLLTEPGTSVDLALDDTAAVHAFLSGLKTETALLANRRAQDEKAHADASKAYADALADKGASEETREAARLDREAKAKAFEESKQKLAAATEREQRLAAAAANVATANTLLQPYDIAAGKPYSPGFQQALTAAVDNARQDPKKDKELADRLQEARANNYGLTPATLQAARDRLDAARLAYGKPADDTETAARNRIDQAIARLDDAIKARPQYVARIEGLGRKVAALAALRQASAAVTGLDLGNKIKTTDIDKLRAEGNAVAAKAGAYARAVDTRVLEHNKSIDTTPPTQAFQDAAKAENAAAQAFRSDANALKKTAGEAAQEARKLRIAAVAALNTLVKSAADLPDGPAEVNRALGDLRRDAGETSALIDTVANGLSTIEERSKRLVEIAGSAPKTMLTDVSPTGNVRCDNGMAARRGFQILGPEGFRTFDQDERLLMAMTSNARPLIGMLTDLSNRAINARKGSVDGGRAIADERRRVGRARDVLDTVSALGKDTDYSPAELAKRVSTAFAETGDRKAR